MATVNSNANYTRTTKDVTEMVAQPAVSTSADTRTLLLLAVLAFTGTFSFGLVVYSVNTAMFAFKTFVNVSLHVSTPCTRTSECKSVAEASAKHQ
jgi:hypothetical protein